MNTAEQALQKLRGAVLTGPAIKLDAACQLWITHAEAAAILTEYGRLQASNAALREALTKCAAAIETHEAGRNDRAADWSLGRAHEAARAALNDTKGD